MACVYFTAASLDGFIVDDQGSLDWLTSRAIDADGPFGYKAFETGVGASVMGAATHEWLLANERSEWTLAETGVNGDFVCARWRVRR